MLTKGIIFGLVAPFLFKPRAATPINDNAAPMPTLPMPSVASVAIETSAVLPWPELPQARAFESDILPPEAAVSEFLEEMKEFGGGEEVRFCRLAWSYEDMRRGRVASDDCAGYAPRPWPPLKSKTLSQLLCSLGCERIQRDYRASGEGRPTYIVIPVSGDVEGDEVSAEPMRLVA
jgi:hypothetical protein